MTEASAPMLVVTSLEEVTGTGEAVTLIVCTGALMKMDDGRLCDRLLVQLRPGPRHLLLDTLVDALSPLEDPLT
jgi:hypothetical protein